MQTWQEDNEESLLFALGDIVWLDNKCRRKRNNSKLQPKFVGPHHAVPVFPNHTYLIERSQQTFV